MCGIFCSVARHGFVSPDDATKELLRNRGPDSTGQKQLTIDAKTPGNLETSARLHATFLSTVLSLRGDTVVEQPLQDEKTTSTLCWNGEAWTVAGKPVTGNDSQLIFTSLLSATTNAESIEASILAVVALLASVRGPYAFVFYDATHRLVYYGRDCLGRRSLLRKTVSDHSIILSSVCDNASGESWTEVEADGVYILDLTSSASNSLLASVGHVPNRLSVQEDDESLVFTLPFSTMNREIPPVAYLHQDAVARLKDSLQRSLKLRTAHIREALPNASASAHKEEANVAVLFSGGLDCTILARMCHDLLQLDQGIDLLNVAFENPRIHSNLADDVSPYELCPDRVTGRASFAELKQVCPGRHWQFVKVNVPYTETVAHRPKVMALMHPHNTEMDLSISFALYFASRGAGVVDTARSDTISYTTPARVLLSGLGADELFGGYQRHATAFARQGYDGLLDELDLDFKRLGKRNLGRDDRIISNAGREVRFPFLDEDFIALALRLPAMVKCDFGKPQVDGAEDPVEALEPAKRILRLLAWNLGMEKVAGEKKRAIQFGARTAKMETGRTKGTHVLV
ncbi:asparagine synthase-domain-containing protein [Phaeosphaeria sp. MPI-PUGE-AT-0046c]|nr:asparagine synthase-domain-containing protein [Phaeosphaeria sp. MPI-PUGE-AT-0046c]